MKKLVWLVLSLLFVTSLPLFSAQNDDDEEENEDNKQRLTRTVYKWVDKNGKVHFSDTPRADAKPIVIRDAQAVDATVPQAGRELLKPKEKPAEANLPEKFQYQKLIVTSPQPDQALWSNDGIVDVKLTLQPALRGSDYLKVSLDGEVVKARQGSTSFQLSEVIRGTHELKIDVFDKHDRLLFTESATFHVHKQSAKGPNRGN